MSGSDSLDESGWALIQKGLRIQKEELADVQQKLVDNEKKLEANQQQVETLTKLNDQLCHRNKSLTEDSEKFAHALTSSKGKYTELEAAHKQLKQEFIAKKEKLVEANAALATSYQNAEELRQKLADAEAKIAAYKGLFENAKNIGGEAMKTEVVKQEPEECSAMDEMRTLDAIQPSDKGDEPPVKKKFCVGVPADRAVAESPKKRGRPRK